MPKFSVIIPNYNREKSVLKAINSVLDQSYKDFELIIVDDCSTDDSIERINDLKDPRIQIVKLEKNSGAAAARNFGIEISKGEYISLLDSDDHYEAVFLEETINRLGNTEKNVGFCWTGVRYFEKEDKTEFFWRPNEKKTPYLTFLHSLHIGTNSGITVKKEVFKNCGLFREDLPAAEDTEFFLRVTQAYNYTYVPKTLVNIHRDGGDRLSKDFKKIAIAYNKFLPSHFLIINRDKLLQKKFYYKMMWLNYHLNDRIIARSFYSKIPEDLRSYNIKIVRILYEYLPLQLASILHQKLSS